jgi:hypothetical protein
VALLEKRRFLYNHSGDFPQVILIVPSHVPNSTKNPSYVFQEMKLRGLNPNSYSHVSVGDLYVPRIVAPTWLQQNRQIDPGNI